MVMTISAPSTASVGVGPMESPAAAAFSRAAGARSKAVT
jgi:hypothetical protein